MKKYESSGTKSFKATYTGACTTAENKGAATKDVKHRYDKVFDMLSAMLEVKIHFLLHHTPKRQKFSVKKCSEPP